MSPHRPITPSPPHADPGPSMQMRYAAETYLTDIPRQIKTRCYVLDSAIGERSELRPIAEMENRILAVIASAFGLPWPIPPAIGEPLLEVEHPTVARVAWLRRFGELHTLAVTGGKRGKGGKGK